MEEPGTKRSSPPPVADRKPPVPKAARLDAGAWVVAFVSLVALGGLLAGWLDVERSVRLSLLIPAGSGPMTWIVIALSAPETSRQRLATFGVCLASGGVVVFPGILTMHFSESLWALLTVVTLSASLSFILLRPVLALLGVPLKQPAKKTPS